MELEESSGEFAPVDDRRPTLPPPLPVRLAAIRDVSLPTMAGIEPQLQDFYVKLLGFERSIEPGIVFHAENFDVRFELLEGPPQREDFRPLMVEVTSLREVNERLIAMEIEFTHEKGITPGQECILVFDPAGNWVQISEVRLIL